MSSNFQPRTSNGYDLYEVISAWTKDTRRGNEDAAIYWTLELVNGGYPQYFWRRIGVFVGEDIGLANPLAAVVINNLADMYIRRLKTPSVKGGEKTYHRGGVIVYHQRCYVG